VARLGAYTVDDKKPIKPADKFRKITDDSVEDDYEHNLWMATQDIWVEMYVTFDMPFDEIKEKIHDMIQTYIDFERQYAVKDFHKMSAHKRRKHR